MKIEHPAQKILSRVFSEMRTGVFQPTGITKSRYLELIAANVAFFLKHQAANGAIIDPYARTEKQYSTPAFAFCAALLVHSNGDKSLISAASAALTRALEDLLAGRTANRHADFYIPLIMHAQRLLAAHVPPEQAGIWQSTLQQIDPEQVYRGDLKAINWNVISTAGECLRHHWGSVAPDRQAKQLAYIEESLARHLKLFTAYGMYQDPGMPLAYDAFARVWLDDVMSNAAYSGKYHGDLSVILQNGALSSLLLISPSGEYPSGGRSALHNWNEAQLAAIFEMHAVLWRKAGRHEIAGAFKRVAHSAFLSLLRWQRPSGDLWIVKNRADPAQRFGYEYYSFHSQYNLIAMALAGFAYLAADDSIVEAAAPSECSSYLLDLREPFHKIIAAADGYYVLIDTGADAHYNATGVQRVHRAGVPFPALSDSAAGERTYAPVHLKKIALTPGMQWKSSADAPWQSLADFASSAEKPLPPPILSAVEESGSRVVFDLDYMLTDTEQRAFHLIERYTVTNQGLDVTSKITGLMPHAIGFSFPVLVSDGFCPAEVTVNAGTIEILHRGSKTFFEVPGLDVAVKFSPRGPACPAHNGMLQSFFCELPQPAPNEIRWRISLA